MTETLFSFHFSAHEIYSNYFHLFFFLQSMKQASPINRIKFPTAPTSKHFIFPIGFNGITSLLHYRLLIRFLFLNEKHVRQSGRRLPLLSLGLLLSTEQYVTPPHSQRGAGWKCGNLCNSMLIFSQGSYHISRTSSSVTLTTSLQGADDVGGKS